MAPLTSIILTFFISLFIAIVLFGIVVLVVNHFYRSDRYIGPISDHFDGKHFYNIGWSSSESRRIEIGDGKKGGLLYWLLHREKAKWVKRVIAPTTPPTRVDTGIHITNVGHATYLIQADGKNILTDPVWGDRASPWTWAGPRRYTDPGIRFDELPKIDIILLSHNHYDHMEISTLRKLEARDFPTIYTGLGNKKYLADRGIVNVIEMDWWEKELVNDKGQTTHEDGYIGTVPKLSTVSSHVSVTYLPAQHFSARGVTDRNYTLWGGFRLEIAGRSIYFAGDTGYGKFIENIREKYQEGFDIGLIPIGAYKPRWFMAPVHTDPFEGMQLQREMKIKHAIGIHYGTFDLADDNQDDPVDDLALAKEREESRKQDFQIGPSGTVWQW